MRYAITDKMLNDVAITLPEPLDSHEVIFGVKNQHPAEYEQDRLVYIRKIDPVHTLHSVIGRRLAGLGTLNKTRKVRSINVRGRATSNQEWRRR